MQPSSLIFLVIVAIWVAYLVQHWVRRREHLATARSVDKFSEAMRVLERRAPLPTTMLATSGTPNGPSAGATSAGATAVATSAGAAAVISPLRARVRADGPLPPAHAVPPIELVPHRTFAQVLLRRVRGVLFLAGLVAVPATVVLSTMHILKWVSVLIAVLVLAAVTVWLRVGAIQDQAARRARRTEHRRAEEARARVAAVTPATRRTGAAAEVQTEVAAEAQITEPSPGEWQPVPVPPPTYTLKEPAHRAEPRRAEPWATEPRATEPQGPVPIEVEDDEIEIMAVAHRRRVGS